MPKILMTIGLTMFLAGVIWFFLEKFGFRGLPGDIHIQRKNLNFHFPIVTCIALSIALSLLSWLLRR